MRSIIAHQVDHKIEGIREERNQSQNPATQPSPIPLPSQFAIEMNASPELTRRVWKSYGATTIIFEYLGQKEAHKFQGADKWMYKRGVCRVFVRVRLREGLRYFVDARGRVILYDPRNGAVSAREVLPDWREYSIPVQVAQDLYSYFEGEWSKYTLIQTDGWIRSQKARSSANR